MSAHTCPYCQKRVKPGHPETMRSVVGWEEKRDQGGANMIHLRRTTGSYAHGRCVDLEKQGTPRSRRYGRPLIEVLADTLAEELG